MGFHLKVEDGKLDILRKLRLSPSEVFGKPYGGYMLFLIGGADEEILEWLSKNIVALDSLTGKDVAFVIFAQQIKIKLYTGEKHFFQPPKTTTINMEEIIADPSLNKIAKSGKCGWVKDGDEINAITYAVDAIARNFGVLNDLPCILILDAIPRRDFEVFHLTNQNTRDFFPFLRKIIQKLNNHPYYSSLIEKIKEVIIQQNLLFSINQQIESQTSLISSLDKTSCIDSYEKLITKIRSALFKANLHEIIHISNFYQCKIFFGKEKMDSFVSAVRNNQKLLHEFEQTIYKLQQFSEKYNWPLNEPWITNYLNVYDKYVCQLLPNLPKEPNTDFSSHCELINIKLRNLQKLLIEEIIFELPSYNEYRETADKKNIKYKNERLNSIAQLKDNKRAIESALIQNVTNLYDDKYPSLTSLFSQEVNLERKMTFKKQIINSGTAYIGSWLKPENLIEVWKGMHHLP